PPRYHELIPHIENLVLRQGRLISALVGYECNSKARRRVVKWAITRFVVRLNLSIESHLERDGEIAPPPVGKVAVSPRVDQFAPCEECWLVVHALDALLHQQKRSEQTAFATVVGA